MQGNNANQDGGGLSISDGDVTIRNSRIANNTSGVAGGGIYISGGTVAMTGLLVQGNLATGVNGDGCGGGVYVATGANATVTFADGLVLDNASELRGGGYWNGGTNTSTVTNSLISGNDAQGPMANMGGGGLYNSGTLRVEASAVIGNVASGTLGSGGGFIQLGGSVTVVDSRVAGNTANRAGGGYEVTRGDALRIENSLLEDNSTGDAPGNGGALHVSDDTNFTTDVVDSLVTDNFAASEGGGLWNQSGSTMNVVNTGVVDNAAGGDDASMGGGGLYNNGGTLNVTNSLVEDNDALGTSGSGGGLLSVGGPVTVTDSLFTDNVANRAGGGIEITAGSIDVNNTGLVDNGAGVEVDEDDDEDDDEDNGQELFIALGDSITFGETDLRYIPSDGTDTGYPTRVVDGLDDDLTLLNFAIDGETADSFMDNTGRTPPVVGRTDVPLQLQNTNYDEDDLIPQQQLFLNTVADAQAAGDRDRVRLDHPRLQRVGRRQPAIQPVRAGPAGSGKLPPELQRRAGDDHRRRPRRRVDPAKLLQPVPGRREPQPGPAGLRPSSATT